MGRNYCQRFLKKQTLPLLDRVRCRAAAPQGEPNMNAANDSDGDRFSSWWFPWNWSAKFWMAVLTVIVIAIPFTIRAVMIFSIPSIPEPPQVAALLAEEISDEENAFTEYKKATDLRMKIVERYRTQLIVEPTNFDLVFQEGWKSADESLKSWLIDHQDVMTIWAAGTSKERAIYRASKETDISTSLPVAQELRTIIRLARLESMRCLADGNSEEAWNWCRRMYRCGGHTTQRSFLVSLLIGMAIHAMSAQGIQEWSEHATVNAEQLKRALRDIQRDSGLY